MNGVLGWICPLLIQADVFSGIDHDKVVSGEEVSNKIHVGKSLLKYNIENLSLKLIYALQNWYSA